MFAVKGNSWVEWKVKEGGNVNAEVKGTVIHSRFTYKSIGGTRNLKTARLWLYTTVTYLTVVAYTAVHYNTVTVRSRISYAMTITYRETYSTVRTYPLHAYTHSLDDSHIHTLPRTR